MLSKTCYFSIPSTKISIIPQLSRFLFWGYIVVLQLLGFQLLRNIFGPQSSEYSRTLCIRLVNIFDRKLWIFQPKSLANYQTSNIIRPQTKLFCFLKKCCQLALTSLLALFSVFFLFLVPSSQVDFFYHYLNRQY